MGINRIWKKECDYRGFKKFLVFEKNNDGLHALYGRPDTVHKRSQIRNSPTEKARN